MGQLRLLSLKQISRYGALFLFAFAAVTPGYGQKFEVSPLFGGRFGGSIKLSPDNGTTTARASLQDSAVYGVAAGFRFDSYDGCQGCDLIEFRWMRQNTNLSLDNGLFPAPLIATSPQPSVHLDHYLGDFTHEFPLEGAKYVRPYITGTLGAAHMSAPAGSATRFTFGIGGGFKFFPSSRFGFRVGVEYLPTVMQAEVQKIVCAGGCIVTVNGGVMNQFQVTVGPTFRF
jgi:hypothetical protein